MPSIFDEMSSHDIEDKYDIIVLVEINNLAEDENENHEVVHLIISEVFDEDYQHIEGQLVEVNSEDYEERSSDKLEIQVTEYREISSVVDTLPLRFID